MKMLKKKIIIKTMNKIRKIPPVCLCIAIVKLLTGRLKLSKEHVGTEFMDYNTYSGRN
jgi:hypothetical protein